MNLYLAAVVVVVNVAIFTYFDASRLRDTFHIGVGPKNVSPHAWASLVFLFLPLALPIYLSARGQAELGVSREGPPPEFTARDLNLWGYLSGIAFLALAVFLGLTGHLAWAALAGLAMAAGLFGGRKAVQVQSAKQGFDLGRAAWDMSSFRPLEGGDQDAEDEDEMAGYGGYIPPIADRAGNVRATPPMAPARSMSAGGVDVFAPPVSPPTSAPAPAPTPARPIHADAAPVVGKATSDDDDVWDPVRADLETQRSAAPAAVSPPPTAPAALPAASSAASSAASPSRAAVASPPRQVEELLPGLFDDEAPLVSDDLAPFELAPDEDDIDEAAGAGEFAEPDDLERLPPLPPLVSVSTYSARRPAVVGPATPTPSKRTAPPPGPYVGAARSSSSPPAVVFWFLGIGALLCLAWWLSRTDPSAPGRAESPTASATDVIERDAGETLDAPEAASQAAQARSAEETIRRQMNAWIATYDSVMRPIATLVEEIDFNGLRTASCMDLQGKAEAGNSKLKHASDEEVELLLRPAFEAFLLAGRACSVGDEPLWAVHLLQAKDHTHETQLLLDERYRYVGPYELEQEEALGHIRSTDSISGRYLAGEIESAELDHES